jgi:hypothetical protein
MEKLERAAELASQLKTDRVLLQGDKSNFRAIIVALQGVTGAPVSVSEKERGEIPAVFPLSP